MVHTHHLSHTTLSHTDHLSLSPTIFHIRLCHTQNFVLLLDPPPHPLSFLPSPSPLQHLVLVIGRSCVVGLTCPSFVWFCSAGTLSCGGMFLLTKHGARMVEMCHGWRCMCVRNAQVFANATPRPTENLLGVAAGDREKPRSCINTIHNVCTVCLLACMHVVPWV